MNDIMDMVRSQLSGGVLSSISGSIGADEQSTNKAIGAVVPVLIGALAKNAAQPTGAAQLNRALERDHDGSLLDNLGGFLQNPMMANGAGILEHVLGSKRSSVESGVAGGTGLNAGQVAQLLTILAPIVMAALGKARKSGGLDEGGLTEMLQQQKQRATNESGGLLGSLTSMLDSEGDGSVMDDLGRIAGGFFNKKA